MKIFSFHERIANGINSLSIGCTATAFAILSASTPANAGWDFSGVNWCGTWNTTWHSSTGLYNSPISVQCSGQVGEATGTYNNGTLSGVTDYARDSFGNPTGVVFRGRWQRTKGDSGGQCPYGQFSLVLTVGDNSINGYPTGTKFFGYWTYCDDNPDWASQRWIWQGYEQF